jgi:hypothetical protein
MYQTGFGTEDNGFRFSNNDIKWSWGPVQHATALCGGMSYAALDYFYAAMEIPRSSSRRLPSTFTIRTFPAGTFRSFGATGITSTQGHRSNGAASSWTMRIRKGVAVHRADDITCRSVESLMTATPKIDVEI